MNPSHPKTKKEKELVDNARLLRAWKNFHREEREAVLAGPHGAVLSELFRMFANIQHVTPAQLVGFVQSINWANVDYAVRLTVLHEINNAITAFRVERDMEPIDDPLLGEPESPFRLIKIILFPPNGAPTGA
jgi:hypothetical protein